MAARDSSSSRRRWMTSRSGEHSLITCGTSKLASHFSSFLGPVTWRAAARGPRRAPCGRVSCSSHAWRLPAATKAACPPCRTNRGAPSPTVHHSGARLEGAAWVLDTLDPAFWGGRCPARPS
eukprot:scaffold52472_cov69-Phaeocystis_antarctica.AAC.3